MSNEDTDKPEDELFAVDINIEMGEDPTDGKIYLRYTVGPFNSEEVADVFSEALKQQMIQLAKHQIPLGRKTDS